MVDGFNFSIGKIKWTKIAQIINFPWQKFTCKVLSQKKKYSQIQNEL